MNLTKKVRKISVLNFDTFNSIVSSKRLLSIVLSMRLLKQAWVIPHINYTEG